MWDGKGYPAAAGEGIPLATPPRARCRRPRCCSRCTRAGPTRCRQVRRRVRHLPRPRARRRLPRPGRRAPGGPRRHRRLRGGARVGARPGPARRRRRARGGGPHVREPRRPQEPLAAGSLLGRRRPGLGRRGSARVCDEQVQTRSRRRAPARPRPGRGLQPDLGQAGAADASTERDQARLHPYYSERILSRTPGPGRRRAGSSASTTSAATAAATTAALTAAQLTDALAGAGGGRRLPDPGRGAAAPAGALPADRGRRPAAGRGPGRPARRGRRRGGPRRPPASAPGRGARGRPA